MRGTARTWWLVTAIAAVCARAGSAAGADPVGLRAYDFRYLPLLRAGSAHLASSVDPTGGNADRGQYKRIDGAEAVLMDAAGPGMITRIWSANPQGTLRVYFDGEPTARLQLPLAELGRPGPRTPTVEGFVSEAGGGVSCWYPMPFRTHCKVTVEGTMQLYYQVNHTTFPSGTAVETFTAGTYRPPSGDVWGTPETRQASLAPGGSAVLFDRSGPATIRRLVLEVTPPTFEALRSLRLVMRWDDAPRASVDAPLLDFFACGLGPAQYLSAPMAVTGWDFFQLDFPLPFERRGQGRLSNAGSRAVTVKATSYATAGRRADDGYFQAEYHDAETVAGAPHRVLATTGRGHYVGTSVTLRGEESLTYLEGDEQLTVDGAERLFGTGTEDYFDGAWFFRRGPYAEPYAGAPMMPCAKKLLAAYRWHIADCIPFKSSLKVDLEHGPRNDSPGCRYRSVAYWYAARPTGVPASRPPAPPAPCAADGGAQVVEAEGLAGQVTAEGATVAAAGAEQASVPPSGGQLLVVTFTGAGGASLKLPLKVAETGLYEIAAVLAGGGVDAEVTASVDGKELVEPAQPPSPGERLIRLGRGRLVAGERSLSLRFAPYGGDPVTGRWLLDLIELKEIGKLRDTVEAEDLEARIRGRNAALVVQELDDLPAGATRAGNVIGGAVPTEPLWSGGAQMRFAPADDGESVSFGFEADPPGDFALGAVLTRGPDYGACRILLDGRRVATVSTASDSLEVGYLVALGTHPLREGRHTLTFRPVRHQGRLAAVGIDCLVVRPSPRGNEAEHLVAANAEAGRAVVKQRFGAEPRWSGGAYVQFPAPAGPVQLFLFAPRSGRYRVTVTPARVPTAGQFTVRCGDGAATIDGHAPAESLGQATPLECRLRRGGNPLTITTAGGDVALDVIGLEFLAPTVPWAAILAVLAVLLLATLARRRRQ